MYQNGYGVQQNYGEAIEWYKKAAEQGDADAQNNLDVMYQNGYGVQQYAVIQYEKCKKNPSSCMSGFHSPSNLVPNPFSFCDYADCGYVYTINGMA